MTLNEQVSLNRQVAEALGWRVMEIPLDASELSPEEVPNYAGKPGLALRLLPSAIKNRRWVTIRAVILKNGKPGWRVVIIDFTLSGRFSYRAEDAKQATAIVKAWLPWEAVQ